MPSTRKGMQAKLDAIEGKPSVRVCRGFCHCCEQYVRVTLVGAVWLCGRCMREALWQLDRLEGCDAYAVTMRDESEAR